MTPPASLHELLDAACAARPAGNAVRDAWGVWTYTELAERSRGAAHHLRRRGVRPGDRVVVHAAADRRVVALLYGCSRVGATLVPLSVAARGFQRDQIVRDADPALVVGSDAELAAVEPAGGPAPDAPPGAAPALLLYTSGSTAQPKGVVCPARQVLFATAAIAARLAYRPDDVVFCRLPLSFDYGLYQVFLAALATAELALAPPSSDAGLLALLRRYGATVVPIVPSLAPILLRLAGRNGQPTRVRLFTNTGDHLPQPTVDALRERFPGAGVRLMFGITECKRVSIMEVDGDRRRPGALGRPLTGTSVRVLGDGGEPLPAGETGQLVVAGPHVMAGYWRAPELTARVFRADPVTGEPLLYTGDWVHLDADGYLYFHGRRDAVFKRRGVRTSCHEIEAAALDVPGVAQAAVRPPADGRDAALFVVASVSAQQVLRALHDRLEPAKVPGECRVVDRLPYGATGKLDRAALRTL